MSRKLDEAISEAMGIPCFMLGPKYYTTDGNAMLELISEMNKKDWRVYDIEQFGLWRVTFCTHSSIEPVTEEAENIPLAVALAAYKALTGEAWKEEG